jgi:O-antigen ligase
MAGASIVATFTTMMAWVVMVPIGKGRQRGPFEWVGRILLSVIFIYASWATVSRGGWVCGAAGMALYWFLKTQRRAVVGYALAAIAFGCLLGVSPWIQKSDFIYVAEHKLRTLIGGEANAYANRAIVLGTATDRVKGWVNLTTNPDVWTPFGLRVAGVKFDPLMDTIYYGHDFIIEFLLKYGYVGLGLASMVGVFVLVKINKICFSAPQGSEERSLCRLAIAFAGGIFVGGLGNGAQLWVYPQNFYFYLCISLVYATYVQSRRQELVSQSQPERMAPPNNGQSITAS